ncbi:hypothetical protein FHS86_002168 [Roseimarinus sediminis]|jgi:hypothetical protein
MLINNMKKGGPFLGESCKLKQAKLTGPVE